MAAAGEWQVNPNFSDWPGYNQRYERMLDGVPWALPTPATPQTGWVPPAPLNVAQLALLLDYTQWQHEQGVPGKEWLMVPTDEILDMFDEGQQRPVEVQAAINLGWHLHRYDVRAAACGDKPLWELVPYLNSVTSPELYPIKGKRLELWRQQMEAVRRSVLGDDAVRPMPLPPPPPPTKWAALKAKLRKLFIVKQRPLPAGKGRQEQGTFPGGPLPLHRRGGCHKQIVHTPREALLQAPAQP